MLLVDRDLAVRLERMSAMDNAAFALSHLARIEGSKAGVLRVAGGLAAVMGPGQYVNKVSALGLDEPITDHHLDEIESFFAERSVPVELHLCPWVEGADLATLARRDYALCWFRSMYVMEVPAVVQVRDPANFRLEQVDDHNEPTWRRTHSAEFVNDADALRANHEFCTAIRGAGGAIDFIAWIEDVPVGVCSLMVRDDRAWLGGMSTLPRYRRLGVQSLLIRHRLRIARKMGCEIAVSSADVGKESSRNLERHGFQLAYTTFGMRRRP